MFALKKLLESKGHEVMIFSMHHPKNYRSDYEKYFVSYIDYAEEIKNKTISTAIKVLRRSVFSIEAKKKIRLLIEERRPDIVHLQNIHHHITPSILYEIKKYNIPIVWTLHDYTIICPNTSFLAGGSICEKCKKHKYYWPLITRCKKNSFSASAMAAIETICHRIMRVYDMVDIFVSPSIFLRDKFIEYGFSKEKIVHVDHFIDYPLVNEVVAPQNYYLYVGRLSEEKGVKSLIKAAIRIDKSKLKVAGGGPLYEDLLKYVKDIDKANRIEFLGHKSRMELLELYKHCKFLVVPSEWYENSGLIIFEAFACGKPVIGANIGGIPELVRNKERGIIYPTGDVDELYKAISWMLDNPEMVSAMGKNALHFLNNSLTPEIHYNKIVDIYNKLL
jgi:glycosyltransferase involved in cell wall biosynthesis